MVIMSKYGKEIKFRLVTSPIMVTLDWNKEFDIMYDVSDYAMGAKKYMENEQ